MGWYLMALSALAHATRPTGYQRAPDTAATALVGRRTATAATPMAAESGAAPSPTPNAWSSDGSPDAQNWPGWNSRVWSGPSTQQLRGDWITDNYGHALMTIPGVWGVGAEMNIPSSPFHAAAQAQGVTDYQIYIGVHVTAITPEIEEKVPTVIDGFPVVLEVGGIPHG